MPKRLSLLFLFVISIVGLVSPKITYAVDPGKIDFGPIELDIPEPYPEGQLQVRVDTGAVGYNFLSGVTSGCTRGPDKRGPCIGKQQLDIYHNPAGPSNSTHIIITLERIVNGAKVPTGTETGAVGDFVFVQGRLKPTDNPNIWVADPPDQGSTDFITFKFVPKFGRPEVSVKPNIIAKNESAEVSIILPDPKAAEYEINVLGTPAGLLKLKCDKGTCSMAEISEIITGSKYETTNNKLTFTLEGKNLTEGQSYIVSPYFRGKPASEDYSARLLVKSAVATNINIALTTPFTPFLSNQTKNATIGIKLIDGTSEDYNVNLRYRLPLQDEKVISKDFSCDGPGCSTSIQLPNQGLEAGPYLIRAVNKNRGNLRGETALIIGNSTPAPIGIGGGANGGKTGISTTGPKTFSGGIPCDTSDGRTPQNKQSAADFLSGVPTERRGIMTAIGCVPTEPQKLIQGLFRVGIGLGGAAALLLMIGGAFQFITSAGNPDAVKSASETFTQAIIGLLVIIFAVLLLQVIGVDILDIPGFER